MPGVEHISLSRCRVLYLGSAIPLETAVGLESIQGPCRDRFDNVDSDQRASGIDSVLSVYSSGLLLQYSSDHSTSTWFPIQTLHVCAAVKAVGGNGPLRFVSLDSPAAQNSNNPPMFACIMRRTKGIKVLECHVFICKSNQAAMALVQSCMHAFGHKEGWMNSAPVPTTRIVPDVGGRRISDKKGGSVRGGDLFLDRHDLVQKFDVSCNLGSKGSQQGAMAPSNQSVQPGQNAYFADWNACGGQPLMIIPSSPFYPGEVEMERYKRKKKKKKKLVVDSSDSEDETYFVRKSELLGGGNECGGGMCVKIKKGRKCCEEKRASTDDSGGVVVYAPQYVEANTDNVAVASYVDYSGIYDPEYYYCQGAEDQRKVQAAFDAGYYEAEAEAYECYEEDGGYGLAGYLAYPGYTDDYGESSYGEYVQQPAEEPPYHGHFELRPQDDYVLRYKKPEQGRSSGQFVEVANGLGYYP